MYYVSAFREQQRNNEHREKEVTEVGLFSEPLKT